MSADILQFTGETLHDIPADQVLTEAVGKLDKVIIIGFKEDGELYMAASCGKVPEAIYLLELCKMHLMEGAK